MKSSLASTPMACWMSMKRSGFMWANWRTPPFMLCAQRSRTAATK